MTTTTLPHKPKLVPTAAPPEPMHPCRTALAKLLAEHAAITAGIEEFESRLQRSQLDLNEAISKDDDVEISRFSGMESVFNLKISAKRSTLAKLLAGFPAAISSAANEFGTALLAERSRRASILAGRVADALQTDKKRMLEGRFLDDVIDMAGPVQAIDQLRFSFSLVNAPDAVTSQHGSGVTRQLRPDFGRD